MNSALYECSVMHRRLVPKEHHFAYQIFMLYLDLDEIDALAAKSRVFSRNSFNLYTFCDDDHLKFPEMAGQPLKQRVIAYLAQNGVDFPASGRVMLVTLPRFLGYIFNPVSFYFCYDPATPGGAASYAIAEVTNTFHEMKLYFLGAPKSENFFRLIIPKHFYVSPFSNVELQFDFKLRVPGEVLDIHVDDRDGEARVLLSALTGKRAPFDTARLLWFAVKYPFITLKVISLIHWNALLLWIKRIPFFLKTVDIDKQRGVLNPHASLNSPKTKP